MCYANKRRNLLKTLDKLAFPETKQYYFARGVSRNIITKKLQPIDFITQKTQSTGFFP